MRERYSIIRMFCKDLRKIKSENDLFPSWTNRIYFYLIFYSLFFFLTFYTIKHLTLLNQYLKWKFKRLFSYHSNKIYLSTWLWFFSRWKQVQIIDRRENPISISDCVCWSSNFSIISACMQRALNGIKMETAIKATASQYFFQ